MNTHRIILISLFCFGHAVSSLSFACGSEWDLTDEQITSSDEVLAVISAIELEFGPEIAKSLSVESIVHSGNDILNLDKVVVASAMCAANYIHIFIESGTQADGLVCSIMIEPQSRGGIKIEDGEFRVGCRVHSEAKAKLLVVPFEAKASDQ